MLEIITWNPDDKQGGTLSNNNLTVNLGEYSGIRATKGQSKGKWYWEVIVHNFSINFGIGISNLNFNYSSPATGSEDSKFYYYVLASGSPSDKNDTLKMPESTLYGHGSFANGDIIGIALDMDNYILEFFHNGVSQGVSHTNINNLGKVFPTLLTKGYGGLNATAVFEKSNFSYDPPTGFSAYQSCKSFIQFHPTGEYKKLVEGDIHVSENVIPAMTSNTDPSGIASSKSTFSSSYPAWKAFDKVTSSSSSRWISGNGHTINGQWLSYEFPSPKFIGRYSLTCGTSGTTAANDMPKSWTFEGSNNGVDWTVLDERLNETDWSYEEKRYYDFENITSFKVYRVFVTENNGYSYYTSIQELEMFEVFQEDAVWETVSTTLPTQQQFETEGMEDLSIFDRKPKKFSQDMANDGTLGNGKKFSSTIDFKKYLDITSIKINKVN